MAKNIEKDPTIGMMMSDHTIGEAEEGGTDLQEDTIDLIALIEGTMIGVCLDEIENMNT